MLGPVAIDRRGVFADGGLDLSRRGRRCHRGDERHAILTFGPSTFALYEVSLYEVSGYEVSVYEVWCLGWRHLGAPGLGLGSILICASARVQVNLGNPLPSPPSPSDWQALEPYLFRQ